MTSEETQKSFFDLDLAIFFRVLVLTYVKKSSTCYSNLRCFCKNA